MPGQAFEWDEAKAASNLKDHRVSFEEAMSAFGDPLAQIHNDPDHSEGELREILAGYSTQGRLLLVSFTERGKRVRLISARCATRQERQDHEQSGKQQKR